MTMGEMTPHGSKYEEKVSKEEAKETGAGHHEMARVKSASGAPMPSSSNPYGHESVHEAYRGTDGHGMVSSHDGHRDGGHHETMGKGEHRGMPHHKNRP
jgi:hypothetical protein